MLNERQKLVLADFLTRTDPVKLARLLEKHAAATLPVVRKLQAEYAEDANGRDYYTNLAIAMESL